MAVFSVILAAAGKSSRFGNSARKKPFTKLKGKQIWLYSAELFYRRPDVKQLIIVVSSEDRKTFMADSAMDIKAMNIEIAMGGDERADSVENALAKVDSECEFVAIHDAARPCIDDSLIESVFKAAQRDGAAIPAIPVHSTLKKSISGTEVDETVDRSNLYLAQTPQAFDRRLIESTYASRGARQPTDESELVEIQGHPVTLVTGSPWNIKITTREDIGLALSILDTQKTGN